MICNPSFGCEDVLIMAALASCGSAVFNPEVRFLYNIVDGSISNSSNPIKSARFYLKSLRTSRILSAYYHLPQSRLKEMFEAKTLYLSATAFDTNDNGFLQELKKEPKRMVAHPDKKNTTLPHSDPISHTQQNSLLHQRLSLNAYPPSINRVRPHIIKITVAGIVCLVQPPQRPYFYTMESNIRWNLISAFRLCGWEGV